jgi:hypothetical protein
MATGTWLLSTQDIGTSRPQTGLYIAVLGLGMGFLMQTTLLIAQNSVEQKDLGVASSTSTFFRSIGGSFGVSLFGAIFNHRFAAEITDRLGAAGTKLTTAGARLDPTALKALPAPIRLGFLESLATSIGSVFGWAIVFAAAIPVLALFIKQIPLRGTNSGDDKADGKPATAEDAMAREASENALIAAAE